MNNWNEFCQSVTFQRMGNYFGLFQFFLYFVIFRNFSTYCESFFFGRFTGLYLVSRCRSRFFFYFYYRWVIESTMNLTDSLREFKSDFGCVHGNVKFTCRYLYFTNSNIKQYVLFSHTPYVIRKWKKTEQRLLKETKISQPLKND